MFLKCRYVYVVFIGEDGVSDDVEFFFSDFIVDVIVNVRFVFCVMDFKDSGRNGKRLEVLCMEFGWEQVFFGLKLFYLNDVYFIVENFIFLGLFCSLNFCVFI